jgi:hypothetical protein
LDADNSFMYDNPTLFVMIDALKHGIRLPLLRR